MIHYLKLETFSGVFSVNMYLIAQCYVPPHKGRGILFLPQFPSVLVLHLMAVCYLMNHWLTLICKCNFT